MKTLQLQFKTLLFLLLVSFIFASCGDDKDGDKKTSSDDANLKQVNTAPVTNKKNDATRSNKSKSSGTTITEGDSDSTSPN